MTFVHMPLPKNVTAVPDFYGALRALDNKMTVLHPEYSFVSWLGPHDEQEGLSYIAGDLVHINQHRQSMAMNVVDGSQLATYSFYQNYLRATNKVSYGHLYGGYSGSWDSLAEKYYVRLLLAVDAQLLSRYLDFTSSLLSHDLNSSLLRPSQSVAPYVVLNGSGEAYLFHSTESHMKHCRSKLQALIRQNHKKKITINAYIDKFFFPQGMTLGGMLPPSLGAKSRHDYHVFPKNTNEETRFHPMSFQQQINSTCWHKVDQWFEAVKKTLASVQSRGQSLPIQLFVGTRSCLLDYYYYEQLGDIIDKAKFRQWHLKKWYLGYDPWGYFFSYLHHAYGKTEHGCAYVNSHLVGTGEILTCHPRET
ncbi:MAG: hypothetical protein OXC40_03110 [Proteobacteria bacterium]|nr:hypothetical protein [Pseudomonadota bacterium]